MARKGWRRCVTCGEVAFTMTSYHKWRKNGIYNYCGAFRLIDRDGEADITTEERDAALRAVDIG